MMDESEYFSEIITSEQTGLAAVEVGIRLTHIKTGLTVESTSEKSQYRNKILALEMLEALVKAS